MPAAPAGGGVWGWGRDVLGDGGAGKGREGAEGVDVDLYEAGWPCQVVMCPSLCLGSACSRSMGRGLGSREVPSALYSRSSKARGTRRRMRGFEGWGRHLRSGPATAAKPTFALTHPSNLRETIGFTTPVSCFTVYSTVTVSPEIQFSSARGQSVQSPSDVGAHA